MKSLWIWIKVIFWMMVGMVGVCMTLNHSFVHLEETIDMRALHIGLGILYTGMSARFLPRAIATLRDELQIKFEHAADKSLFWIYTLLQFATLIVITLSLLNLLWKFGAVMVS